MIDDAQRQQLLAAIVQRGNAFAALDARKGRLTTMEVTDARLTADRGHHRIGVGFMLDGAPYEFVLWPADSLISELEAGDDDPEGTALIVVVNLFEELLAAGYGLERAIDDGTIVRRADGPPAR